jgi:hypothetical protein
LLRPAVAVTAISTKSGITQWLDRDHAAIPTLKPAGG